MAEFEQVGLLQVPGDFLRYPDSPSRGPGAAIAGRECLRALLTYAETKVILITSETSSEDLQNELRYLSTLSDEFDKLPYQIAPFSQMPQILSNNQILALHNLNGPFFYTTAYARSQWNKGVLLPITCMEYGFSYQDFLYDAIVHSLLADTYPCDALICTTEVAKKATINILERLHDYLRCSYNCTLPEPFQLAVIPHGVDADLFKPRDKADMRILLELPKDKILILFVGRIDPASKSDVIPLLMAFRRIVDAHGDKVRLLLVGPISETYKVVLDSALKELNLTPFVIFRTNIPKVSVSLYYSAADIFVSLSDTLQENFGLTPLEAMASGLPVIVSDWAGYRESVVHGKTGFKVPTLWGKCDETLCLFAPFYDWTSDHFFIAQSVAIDLPSLVHFLDILITNDDLRFRMGKMAREHVLHNYAWHKVSHQFFTLWRELKAIATHFSLSRRNTFIRPHYFHDFRHFVTEIMDGDALLRVTKQGHQICHRKTKLLLLEDPRNLIRPEIVIKLLRFIRYCNILRFPLTVQQIETILHRKWGLLPEESRRYLLWACKYGLVRIEKEA